MVTRRRPLLRFSWLPIRTRLTIAFVGVMAAVFLAAGGFLYAQFRSDLDAQVDSALLRQTDDVKALIELGRVRAVTSSGLGLAQVYDAGGRLVGSSLTVRGVRLLSVTEAIAATRRQLDIDPRTLAVGTVAVGAGPAITPGGALTAVAVANRLDLRDHELAHLRNLLLIAGPLALLLASITGHELARAALRPVERMRTQAERITERQLDERLPGGESADEVGALSRTLNAMLDRLEAAVGRERQLVSDASHELRTPLTTLRAELELALMNDRNPRELRAAVESAAGEARRMSRLADDLLALARADQGRLPLDREALRAGDVLEAAAARASAAVRIRGRSISVQEGSTDDGLVSADPDRLAQMLDNLVANALHHGDGPITLSAQQSDGLIELHVTDEGPGFAQDTIRRPFERFRRGVPSRSREPGSGLGLALVEAIAAAHGGYASARNRPQGGADVWIALQRAQPPVTDHERSRASGQPSRIR